MTKPYLVYNLQFFSSVSSKCVIILSVIQIHGRKSVEDLQGINLFSFMLANFV